MDAQNEIKRTLKQECSIEVIRGLLAQQTHRSRSSVAEVVCRHFGFFDARQRTQAGGCVKALRELERAGLFVLPAALDRGRAGAKTARRLGDAVEAARDVPDQANEVRGLALIKVGNLAQMRVWNELMIREHPQGAGPLVGAQMGYLIGSEHGWLGGFGFGAAALQLGDRDRWIGWDAPMRRQHLHRVVGMSRFLIRTAVRCQNLASCVQGMALRRLAGDYEAQRGYRPWLVALQGAGSSTSRSRPRCSTAANGGR